jgi:hypothetical protein
LCSENKRKKAGSFVSVKHRKHGKRAWQMKKLGPLPLSLTWGCEQLKRSDLPLCSENKRKKAGSSVSVEHGKHGKRAWQTKELGPLPLSLTWGCQQLKRSGLPLCSENKREKAGSSVSVKHGKHGKRAWQRKKLGPLPLSLTWGCQQLKRSGLPLCSENKRKKAGSFVSVKHGKRAWQTKELVRKEPDA